MLDKMLENIERRLREANTDAELAYQFAPNSYTASTWAHTSNALFEIRQTIQVGRIAATESFPS